MKLSLLLLTPCLLFLRSAPALSDTGQQTLVLADAESACPAAQTLEERFRKEQKNLVAGDALFTRAPTERFVSASSFFPTLERARSLALRLERPAALTLLEGLYEEMTNLEPFDEASWSLPWDTTVLLATLHHLEGDLFRAKELLHRLARWFPRRRPNGATDHPVAAEMMEGILKNSEFLQVGELRVEVQEEGCAVQVDGLFHGLAPLTLSALAGEHRLRAFCRRGQDRVVSLEHRVRLGPGESRLVKVLLRLPFSPRSWPCPHVLIPEGEWGQLLPSLGHVTDADTVLLFRGPQRLVAWRRGLGLRPGWLDPASPEGFRLAELLEPPWAQGE